MLKPSQLLGFRDGYMRRAVLPKEFANLQTLLARGNRKQRLVLVRRRLTNSLALLPPPEAEAISVPDIVEVR